MEKEKHTESRNIEEIYKIYLLQDKGIRHLYQTRMAQYIHQTLIDEYTDKEWVNIKETIEKTAREVLGKRKKKGLKIWNDKIAAAIKEKRKHMIYSYKLKQKKQTISTN
jgi:hypothetical protein